jgi:acylpyruvate hydrolase
MQKTHANVWAVGRNYINHAKEMKAQIPSEPLFFLKAGSCVSYEKKIQLPQWSTNIHHEIEIAFLLNAHLEFSHVALALDLTERDAQSLAKKEGAPWTLSKSFKQACPLTSWIPYSDKNNLFFDLVKNQHVVQQGQRSDMIFNPALLLAYAKNHFPIIPGDILLSGTPEGVGPLKSKDLLVANLWTDSSKKSLLLSSEWTVE